jgi:hypothetical protein
MRKHCIPVSACATTPAKAEVGITNPYFMCKVPELPPWVRIQCFFGIFLRAILDPFGKGGITE